MNILRQGVSILKRAFPLGKRAWPERKRAWPEKFSGGFAPGPPMIPVTKLPGSAPVPVATTEAKLIEAMLWPFVGVTTTPLDSFGLEFCHSRHST